MSGKPNGANPRICFVLPAIYPVLAGSRDIPVIGGSEFRASILARALVRAGYPVSVVGLDLGQGPETEVDGIRVIGVSRPRSIVPVPRWVHPRPIAFLNAMRRANADIYVQMNCSYLTALTAWHAARASRVSVYSGASDTDFMPGEERIPRAAERRLFRWGLRHASALIAQSPRQAQLIERHYGRRATILRNPYAPPPRSRAPRGDLVLWVGGIRPVKRPDRFLELAASLPEYRFRMIGGAAVAGNYFGEIRERARGVPNLEFLGFRPLAEVEEHFDEAHLFVNTSEHEGFPNTLLQAWGRGIPVVSFFDAGVRADGTRAFAHVGSVDEARSAVTRLMTDGAAWRQLADAGLEHHRASHTVESAIETLVTLFARLRSSAAAGRRDPEG